MSWKTKTDIFYIVIKDPFTFTLNKCTVLKEIKSKKNEHLTKKTYELSEEDDIPNLDKSRLCCCARSRGSFLCCVHLVFNHSRALSSSAR